MILFGRESGLGSHEKPYLPREKQFLVTRGVPSCRRANLDISETFTSDGMSAADADSADAWIVAHQKQPADPRPLNHAVHGMNHGIANISDSSDTTVVDIAGIMVPEEDLYNNDMNKDAAESHLVRTRTYDLSITYDKYYQVPRLWLQGYTENGIPLTANQLLEDVSQEHARKTVTMALHPHLPTLQASIHPCKHANIMKKMMAVLNERGERRRLDTIRVDQYLILFLKFMASILPTIEYDYTMALD
jgi:ubiquitin-like-conjugating enzyme ATG3